MPLHFVLQLYKYHPHLQVHLIHWQATQLSARLITCSFSFSCSLCFSSYSDQHLRLLTCLHLYFPPWWCRHVDCLSLLLFVLKHHCPQLYQPLPLLSLQRHQPGCHVQHAASRSKHSSHCHPLQWALPFACAHCLAHSWTGQPRRHHQCHPNQQTVFLWWSLHWKLPQA